jgi:hypothetical protein
VFEVERGGHHPRLFHELQAAFCVLLAFLPLQQRRSWSRALIECLGG